MNKTDIVQMTTKIISDFGIEYPIDLHYLCNFLDIDVCERRELIKDGYLVRDTDKKLIFISSKVFNTGRKRFILAHELGHFFLHPEKMLHICNEVNENFTHNNTISDMEKEANFFASELLAPASIVKNDLPNRSMTFEDIILLARKYNTSVTFMAIKCVENSRTQNELLICYQNHSRQWWTSANDEWLFDEIPEACPSGSLIEDSFNYGKLKIETKTSKGIWENYDSSVTQHVFPISSKIMLTLICGTRKEPD